MILKVYDFCVLIYLKDDMIIKRRWVVALCFIALLSYLPMRAHQLGGESEFPTILNNVSHLPSLVTLLPADSADSPDQQTKPQSSSNITRRYSYKIKMVTCKND